MDANKILDPYFNYGDTVKIKKNAPIRYKPSSLGSICGIRIIKDSEIADQFHQKIGSELYLIEFTNGETLEIPKIFIDPINE